MGQAGPHSAALLVLAAFSRHEAALRWARGRAAETWGPAGPGKPGVRLPRNRLLPGRPWAPGCARSSSPFRRPSMPPRWSKSNCKPTPGKQEYARAAGHAEPRPLNLDPGYLTLAKLVLASTKDFAHRIYLARRHLRRSDALLQASSLASITSTPSPITAATITNSFSRSAASSCTRMPAREPSHDLAGDLGRDDSEPVDLLGGGLAAAPAGAADRDWSIAPARAKSTPRRCPPAAGWPSGWASSCRWPGAIGTVDFASGQHCRRGRRRLRRPGSAPCRRCSHATCRASSHQSPKLWPCWPAAPR